MSEAMEQGGAAPTGELAFADGLGSLARSIQQNLGEEVHSLDFIVSAAVELIPGVESAAVSTLAGKNRLAGQSSVGDLAGPILDAQNDSGEGPCLKVAEGGDQVLIDDLLTDGRWPEFSRRAERVGVRTLLCTPLSGDGQIRGSLSLHARTPGVFNDETRDLARVFASHASIALAGAARHRNVVAALGARDIIGQAKGILMERFGITADAAFAVLLRMSQQLNVKLRDISAELCRTGVLPGTDSPSRARREGGALSARAVVEAAVARTDSSAPGVAGAAVAAEALAGGTRDDDLAVEAAVMQAEATGDAVGAQPGDDAR